MRRILYLFLSVSLFLTGCSQVDTEQELEFQYEKQEESASEESVFNSEQEEEENKVKDKLVSLTRAGVFEWYTTNDVDIKAEDTEEMILQKLDQCEKLGLYVSDEDSLYLLEHLSSMPNLKSLWLTIGCRIDDVSFIAELSRLEDLYIHYDAEEVIDFSFLAEMETITELSLWNCGIRDSAFLEKMSQLESLTLYDTSVDDLAFLENMPELEELTFAGNAAVKNMEIVGKMSRLQELSLLDCGITDISFLGGLTELKSIDIDNNFIADLTPLAGMAKLERLGAERNRISDLSPLAELSNLYDLSLAGNEITDISALGGLSRLNQVELMNNGITDLSPLGGKSELISLNVRGNPYADLRPLWDVPALAYGGGEVTEVTEEEAEIVDNWMKVQHPEIEEYRCIDYVEGDLNQDGRTDIAFVADEVHRPSRQLFVLLKQSDGSWQEIAALPLAAISGRSGAEPYEAIFLGEGYLMSCREIYLFQEGKLELMKETWIESAPFPDVWHVTIKDMEKDTCLKYDVARDGQRMVREEMRYE